MAVPRLLSCWGGESHHGCAVTPGILSHTRSLLKHRRPFKVALAQQVAVFSLIFYLPFPLSIRRSVANRPWAFLLLLVQVGHLTASTKPFSLVHHPGWSWIRLKKHLPVAAAALDVPLPLFLPFLREANMLLFTPFMGPIKLQQGQQRGARDALAAKVMHSCPRRICWQSGFQDPEDLAWEYIPISR